MSQNLDVMSLGLMAVEIYFKCRLPTILTLGFFSRLEGELGASGDMMDTLTGEAERL